ncbi:MAG: M50 family metallopeptidase [Candidatus Rifleibacteriota bacterium]
MALFEGYVIVGGMEQNYFSLVFNQLSFDLPAFVLVILIHEYFHLSAARQLLRDTEKSVPKFSPASRLNFLGTLLPVCLVFSRFPIIFGWGNRVEIDFKESKSPKLCELVFSLAGIMGNLVICLFTGAFIASISKTDLLFNLTSKPAGIFLYTLIFRVFSISLAIMLINFLPIPPFDGGRLIFNLFEKKLKPYREKIQILGLLIVVTLIVTGIAEMVFMVPYTHITNSLCGAFSPYVLQPDQLAADFLKLTP